ncbi:MAG: 50S ribosomal protein L9 [Treponema sp.]|jgi:large subunit ribosomal protein L9|nr:50S ribosomal protein L9 [Treponema sp.]
MYVKVILNKDHAPLGEEGDVKEVARGYARNYLFPKKIAYPYKDGIVKLFEARREEIEKRKAEKRKSSMSFKEKLESINVVITMPAGANGKLYGAVTPQTIVEALAKQDLTVERKRIELAGNSFKNVGNYQATIKLYESEAAVIKVTVRAQEIAKIEQKQTVPRVNRRRREGNSEIPAPPPEIIAQLE